MIQRSWAVAYSKTTFIINFIGNKERDHMETRRIVFVTIVQLGHLFAGWGELPYKSDEFDH